MGDGRGGFVGDEKDVCLRKVCLHRGDWFAERTTTMNRDYFSCLMQYRRAAVRIKRRSPAMAGVAMHMSSSAR